MKMSLSKPKTTRKKKLTPALVQIEFNRAIVRRDHKKCMVQDGLCRCAGHPQCSHFFAVKGNSGLRFYPPNAHCQCAGHHLIHHNRDQYFYSKWMMNHYPEELEWMETVRGRAVRYTQEVLQEILDASKKDNLDRVREIVRGLFV